MKKVAYALVALVLAGSSCAGGGGSDERTILVDYSSDEFASFFLANYPREIEVTPGTTLVFRQTWTGEPHTVTGGQQVNQMMAEGKPWFEFFDAFEGLMGAGADLPDPENPTGSAEDFFRAVESSKQDALEQKLFESYDALREQGIKLPDRTKPGDASFESVSTTVDKESNNFFDNLALPWAFGEEDLTQNGGQPCYLDSGVPPKEEDNACPKSKQRQPLFNGKASYYNSGIIPYEGPQGNTYRVKLDPDIAPGSYFFYCAVHGPQQHTEVRVQPAGTDVPSQADVNRQARQEIDEFAKPMGKQFREAQDGTIDIEGEKVKGPFAGLSVSFHASINEMIPKAIKTGVGDPVTWKLMGADHSISFDVPKYFPIMRFTKTGRVSLNPDMEKPAGGSPKLPEGEPKGIVKIDGGTYDGSGFYSSGLMHSEPYAQYTLRFSKPGTYQYACLLHPPMVGTVEVT